MIRCLITNGKSAENEERWIQHLASWIDRGIDLIQIRERELSARELARLTRRVLHLPNMHDTRILINDRADIALACGAHGVHLRDDSSAPGNFARPGFLVTAACHDPEQIDRYRGADYILLAPIFSPLSKQDRRAVIGLGGLSRAARNSSVPVLALGGISERNVQECIDAGAAGIAGISYFEEQGPSFGPHHRTGSET